VGAKKTIIMTKVKTTISLEKSLLEQVDLAAQAIGISRRNFLILAVEEFLQRSENERLLAAINKAYGENPLTEEEQAQLEAMRRYYAKTLEDEEW
jgi:metal-responsive CopG/Arc/MetJ family transcriptional regulator